VQYVSIMAGWGGVFAISGGSAARGVATGPGKLITYGLATGPPDPAAVQAFITRPGDEADGERLYHSWCGRCHGAGAISKSAIPDLRDAAVRLGSNFDVIVHEGIPGTAMPAFANSINATEAALIRHYLEIKAKQR
jgi:quinohemoprotein ethanol dehydrogenase